MYTIMWKEFFSLLKSFKSIAVVAFFILVTFIISRFLNKLPFQFIDGNMSPYLLSIRFLVGAFGFLFGLALSHDILNREIESQTIRYLVTKIPRAQLIIGKSLGVYLFWIVSITISFLIISYYARSFFLFSYVQLLSFMAYVLGLTILLSFFIRKTTYSMFISVILGILLPALGVWVTNIDVDWNTFTFSVPLNNTSENLLYFIPYFFKFLFPYYYYSLDNALSLLPFVIGILFIIIVIILFKRSDL
jgi:ABC-2 type transport system permease protein